MTMNSGKFDDGGLVPFGWRKSVALCICFALVMETLPLFAQSRQPSPIPQSELARQNQERVAAPVGQLIGIFHKDPGLMVELKRWIAKDATDHGQLVDDADLTEEAIFERLEIDVVFRSVATSMVQKYGYLRPMINPESPLAKQEELLMQERVKWIAQEEGEARAKAREQEKALEQAQTPICDPRSGSCGPQGARNAMSASLPQTQQQGVYPQGDYQGTTQIPGLETPQSPLNGPYVPSVPYAPSTPYPPSQRTSPSGNAFTELLRTSGEDSSLMSQMQGTDVGFAGMSGFTQGEEGGQSALQRSAQKSFLGGGAGQFEDLSLSGDFLGEGLGQDLYAGAFSGSGTYPMNPSSAAGYGGSGTRYDGMSSSPLTMARLLAAKESTSPSQRLVRSPNPFNDVPSLYDMYLQASARPAQVERFGMQVFENGTRDLQMIPMDLPAGPDYVLGTGDGVSVDLWGGVSRRFYRVVDRTGRISLPEVGPVLVAGKSLAEVQESVQKILRTQFRDISADVSLSRLRTIRVYVVGDVLKPGAYDVGSLSTPLNALFAAGGPTGRGSLRIVKHNRGNELVQDVDVYDLLLNGVKGDFQRLENGDTVMVPPLGPQITLEGMVRRPAIYELNHEKSLADAISLAGGLLPTAMVRHIEVQRLVAHEKQTMLSVDVPDGDGSSEITQKLESFQIQDGDKIRIFPIAPYAQDAVYVEGHIIRPGKYSFHEGMRVTDVIGSYKDLLPEPALQYGEIIRLSLPDFHPTVESFNLADALADPSKAPELKALDTVRVFGRYDFESPPVVSVLGDVRAPGTYRTSGDIHIADAVHLAGGLSPDAETVDAQVFRYMPDSTLKILNIKLEGALDGDPSDNIQLKPRDRVLVHKNTAASDPTTVYVKGEVARPGRYPLTGNMRLSDLVLAAGGLKDSADTKTADLTQYSWKNDKQITGTQEQISLADAMAGEPDKDPLLRNGDVLSIRQVPGWADLGSSVTIRGEVVHPGGYGIRPGERLSSVLLRAGGFAPGAYPYGAVLLRTDVQKVEQRSYGELIQRVREQQATLKLTATSASDPDQKLSAESALVQWQSTLDSLVNSPPAGRVSIQISSNIKTWQGTTRDVTLSAGDVIMVPKRPSYVLVQGQVYGPTAVSYHPGKSARWYLLQAGGPTNLANKKAIFVIRADGTVIGNHDSFWASGGLNVTLQPGDMVVVPEKALGGPPVWKAIFQNAQVMSSIATSAILAATYL